jgi:hypothetical protein
MMSKGHVDEENARNIILEVIASFDEEDISELAIQLARVLNHQETDVPYIDQVEVKLQRRLNANEQIKINKVLRRMRQNIDKLLGEQLGRFSSDDVDVLSSRLERNSVKYGLKLDDFVHRLRFVLDREPTEGEIFKLDILFRANKQLNVQLRSAPKEIEKIWAWIPEIQERSNRLDHLVRLLREERQRNNENLKEPQILLERSRELKRRLEHTYHLLEEARFMQQNAEELLLQAQVLFKSNEAYEELLGKVEVERDEMAASIEHLIAELTRIDKTIIHENTEGE